MAVPRRRVFLLSLLFVFLIPLNATERESPRGPTDRDRHERARETDPELPPEDCLQFNCVPVPSDINKDNVAQLEPAWRISIPDIADGAPVYVSNVATNSGERDLLILGTMSGRAMAVDARNGEIVWVTPAPKGPRWTTAAPAVDPDREFVYAYGLDGYVHRYSIFNGSEVVGQGWPQLVTRKGDVEKCSSSLSVVTTNAGKSYLYATIAAYPDPGDEGDYQGHVVAIDLSTGDQNVFNALCSDKAIHFDASGKAPSDCTARQAGIWARAGVVYDSVTDRLFVTTGNGTFDATSGGYNWGSSVVAIRPDGTTDGGTPLDSYTPLEYQFLNDVDWDLSSTTIAILPVQTDKARLAVQSGKDGKLRLLNLNDLSGQGAPRHLGGELQSAFLDTGTNNRPATWLAPDGTAWLFVTTYRSTIAWTLNLNTPDGVPQLEQRWKRDGGGSSPIVDGNTLFRARDDHLEALDPETGDVLWSDDTIGHIHWQSPIVVNDSIYLANHANELMAFRLPRN